jgi:hypothetical protein
MANDNIKIELQSRRDKNGKTFYIGKIKAPVLLDCRTGCAFLIYISEEGAEELQIASMDNRQKDMED